MMAATAIPFVAGLISAGYLVVGIFFLRFWSRTRDALFASFAIAFWLMALGQSIPVVFGIPDERQAATYLLRLSAFGLIIAAIVRKNLRAGGRD